MVGGAAALMNSRPLTHVSVSPDDPEPLTPNHFLLGRASPHQPLDAVHETEVISRRHFRAAQALLDCFWRRWMTEHIPTLTERKKWFEGDAGLAIDDIVIHVDPNTPRGLWPLARVAELLPGRDGVVRVVRIETAKSSYTRSVHHLIRLSVSKPQQSSSPAQEAARFGSKDSDGGTPTATSGDGNGPSPPPRRSSRLAARLGLPPVPEE